MANLQERMRLLRKEKCLKQYEVAAIVGICLSSYCRYEQGLREPTVSMLWRMADLYGVSIDYLVGRTDTP